MFLRGRPSRPTVRAVRRRLARLAQLAALAVPCTVQMTACKGDAPSPPDGDEAVAGGRLRLLAVDTSRCRLDGARVTQHDLDGDGRADIISIYLRGRNGEQLLCQQGDLNRDGTLDAFWYYDDQGEIEREQYDYDHDGRIDLGLFYEGGAIALIEQDTTGDGAADTWRRYDSGRLVRIENDRDGDGKPDMFVFFVRGQIDRIGYDLNGDGRVDQWDHDAARRSRLTAAKLRAPASPSEGHPSGDEFVQEPTRDPEPSSDDPIDPSEKTAKQADAKQADAKQADAKQADAKQADAKQADAKQADAKQADAKQADAKQADATVKAGASDDASRNAQSDPPVRPTKRGP